MDDPLICLKAKTFDIIMAKTRLVEELNALDRVIDQNVREIQGLEQQKISSERQIEVPSSEVLNQNNSQSPPNQSESPPANNHVNLIPIEEEIPPQKKN